MNDGPFRRTKEKGNKVQYYSRKRFYGVSIYSIAIGADHAADHQMKVKISYVVCKETGNKTILYDRLT